MTDALALTFGARSEAELRGILRGDPAPPLAQRGTARVELRLDTFDDASRCDVPALVRDARTAGSSAAAAVIATCRRSAQGGPGSRDELERADLRFSAQRAGADLVDVELGVPLPPGTPPWRVLRSAHVDRLPPGDGLPRLVDALCDGVAYGKLVARNGDERDVGRLLAEIARKRRDVTSAALVGHVVAHPFSRLASLAAGAPFTYAALRPGGRIDVPLPQASVLLERDHAARICAGTRLWVLLGADVEGSVSPQMLNACFAAEGRDAVALRWSVDDVEAALDVLASPALNALGAAVTIPHKRAAHGWVSRNGRLGPVAAAAGAVNTVVFAGEDAPCGANTDAGGALDALRAAGLRPVPPAVAGAPVPGRSGRALVLGAGGAARAAVRGLFDAGYDVEVRARRADRARELLQVGAVLTGSLGDAATVGADVRVVVDATPAGPPGGTPLVEVSRLPNDAVVLDMLIDARETALISAAREHGLPTASGYDMLVAQALRQLRLVDERAPIGIPSVERRRAATLRVGTKWLRHAARPIVLLGLRAAGKSTLAPLIAGLLGREWFDVDDEVTRRLGRSPDDLIAGGEEDVFRAEERRVMLDAARGAFGGPVVATGGGAALSGCELRELCAVSRTVFLSAPGDVLLARLAAAPRAALTDLTPEDELARQLSERGALYLELSEIVVDTSNAEPDVVAEILAQRLLLPPA